MSLLALVDLYCIAGMLIYMVLFISFKFLELGVLDDFAVHSPSVSIYVYRTVNGMRRGVGSI